MSDRELQLPSDDERRRDRELLEALDRRESVGERYARTGEVPEVVAREPAVRPRPVDDGRDPTPVEQIARRQRRRRRWIPIVVGSVLAVLVGYVGLTFWQVRSTGQRDEARPVGAIVVLGAAQYDGRPSPQLAARLDHVVDLWSRGLAPTVVVTGGNQPGDRFTEADASRAYLVERGVPDAAILAEETGSSTYESLENVAELLGDTEVALLLVTDPYHSLRTELTARDVGFSEVHVSPTPSSVVSGGTELRRQLGETAGVAVGRIIGFERLHELTD
jgi:uncharacterized SAM-binding protein YcdF (DUF218 family)